MHIWVSEMELATKVMDLLSCFVSYAAVKLCVASEFF